ncbi:MAG: TIGR02466 family protein, partial [Pseudomonadota bacterium]
FLKVRIDSWRDRDQMGIVRSNVKQAGSWHSPTTMNQLPEFELFYRRVVDHVEQVYNDQRYDPQYQPLCHNMWANINPVGGYNRGHTHPGSLWSGVYYVQTPKNCGRIYFNDPRSQAHVILPAKDKGEQSSEHWPEVFYEAIAGRLILFPSWLRHEVEPNMTNLKGDSADRISISFNFGQVNRATSS